MLLYVYFQQDRVPPGIILAFRVCWVDFCAIAHVNISARLGVNLTNSSVKGVKETTYFAITETIELQPDF